MTDFTTGGIFKRKPQKNTFIFVPNNFFLIIAASD